MTSYSLRVGGLAASTLTAVTLALTTLAAAPQARAQAETKQQTAVQRQLAVQALAQSMNASVTVAEQVMSISDDKETWNAAQRKLDSQFIYAARMASGKEAAPGVPTLDTSLTLDTQGRVAAIIHGGIDPDLRAAIVSAGGEIVSDDGGSIRVNLPLYKIETLAGRSDVNTILRYLPPRHSASHTVAETTKYLNERPLVPFTKEYRHRALAEKVAAFTAGLRRRNLPPWQEATKAASLLSGLTLGATDYNGTNTGVIGEGVAVHDLASAYAKYGADGTGLRIGVLSDSNRYMAQSQTSGDLPPTDATGTGTGSSVTVAVDDTMSGSPTVGAPSNLTGEGTAMMQIVHDIAPGAKIFFASADYSEARFAKYIELLRYKYHCDIIIDDVFYYAEQPFSDDQVAQAVNRVTVDGAMYFSSAGNEGHISQYSYPNPPLNNDPSFTASVWEGDFVDSSISVVAGSTKAGTFNSFTTGLKDPYGTTKPDYGVPYNIADYPPTTNILGNPATGGTAPIFLYWSDKAVGATNDYDLFVTNAAGTTVSSTSATVQNGGASTPYEQATVRFNSRIYVLKKTAAVSCALHLTTFGAYYLDTPSMAFTTNGQTFGHAAAALAFDVAAASAINTTTYPFGGPYPNAFTSSNVSEYFTSDGPRRILWNTTGGPDFSLITNATNSGTDPRGGTYTLPNGTPVFTPVTKASDGVTPILTLAGAAVRQKPEITAADGVTTSSAVTGFTPFFGTSAAAPHAGAIAGVVKSYQGNNGTGTTVNGLQLTLSEMRIVLPASAIDVEAPGIDDTTGAGIVMPGNAIAYLLSFCNPNSVSTFATTTTTATITWTTNLPSNSVVFYGVSGQSLTNQATNSTQTTAHSVTITGLTPGTAYKYRVASTTPTSSVAYSDPSDRTFVTAPGASVGAPSLSVTSTNVSTGGSSVIVTVTNSGTGPATNARITGATLGNASTSSALPVVIGTIAAGRSANASLTFPAQASGSKVVLKVVGTDDSGTSFTYSMRVTVP